MTSDSRDSPSAPAPRPSTALAVVAASLPLLFLILSAVTLLGVTHTPRALVHLFREAGWIAYVTLFAALVSALVCGVLLFLAGRGARIPAALSVFVAAVPWLVGLVGVSLGTAMVTSALAGVDPSSRAMLAAAGISEASGARLLGAWLSSALFAAVALGLALAAIGQRAPGRRWWMGLVAFFFALPALGVVAIFGVQLHAGAAIVLVVVPVLGAALTAGLAAWGAGRDGPRARSGALGASASVAAALACFAGGTALSTLVLRQVLGAVAGTESPLAMLAAGAEDVWHAQLTRSFGTGALLLPAFIVIAWAASRVRPSPGRLAGGFALLLTALLVVGLDAYTQHATGATLVKAAAPPWNHVSDFTPVAVGERGPEPSTTHPILVTRSGIVLPDGTTTKLGDPNLSARLHAFLDASPHQDADAAPGVEPPSGHRYAIQGPLDRAGDDDAQPLAPKNTPALSVALDARLSAQTVSAFAKAAAAAGARSLHIEGEADDGLDETAQEAIRTYMPMVAALAQRPGARVVLLDGALPPGAADADRELLHGTVGHGDGPLRLEGRRAAHLVGMTLTAWGRSVHDIAPDAVPDDPEPVMYLALDSHATAADLGRALASVDTAHGRALLVTDATFPGHPEAPPAADLAGILNGATADGFGRGGLGLGPGGGAGQGIIGLGAIGGLRQGNGSVSGLGLTGRGASGGFGDNGIPLGGIGTIGHSTGGGMRAVGGGAGSTSHVGPGSVEVRGSLARDVIQRVVRFHMNEVRFCYDRSLAHNPALAGHVVLEILIAATGAVAKADVKSSTLGDAAAEACIAAAAERWFFPARQGDGIVVVTYPFDFRPH